MTSAKELLLVTRDEQNVIVYVTCKKHRVFEIYKAKSADLDDIEDLHKKLSGQKSYLKNCVGMNIPVDAEPKIKDED